jgi:uncharacterized membrane protein
MAASTKNQQITERRTNFWSSVGGGVGDLGVNVPNSSESGAVVVAVLLMLLICLFLPLLAMLYFDTLTLQKKAEKTEARIEKLIKNLEEKDKK